MSDNGQVERMNRTIKNATVKRFNLGDHEQLRWHPSGFNAAYNFGRRIQKGSDTLRVYLQPIDNRDKRFRLDPIHQMLGLYIYLKPKSEMHKKSPHIL